MQMPQGDAETHGASLESPVDGWTAVLASSFALGPSISTRLVLALFATAFD